MAKLSIIIPAYNESEHIEATLYSLTKQTFQDFEVIVVDDNSSDSTAEIVTDFLAKHSNFKLINKYSEPYHAPGSKVINAFLDGIKHIPKTVEYVAKFDADLIFPENYLAKLIHVFENNQQAGLVGGQAYILDKNDQWVLENLTNNDHVRGALKCYRKQAFDQINGLQPVMGWDTLDELLLKFYGWHIMVETNLKVKHLKPTGHLYKPQHSINQGIAFYQLGYGFWLTTIASLKLALRKQKPLYFIFYLRGYFKAILTRKPKFVTKEQEQFLRRYRWKSIINKLCL